MKFKFDKHAMPTNANSCDTSTHNQGAALSQLRSEDNFHATNLGTIIMFSRTREEVNGFGYCGFLVANRSLVGKIYTCYAYTKLGFGYLK